MQFLHPVYTDCSLRGVSRWALIELKLLTVVSKEW